MTALPGCKKAEGPPEEGGPREAPVKWEGPERHELKEWTELLGTTQPLPGQVARVSAAVGWPVRAIAVGFEFWTGPFTNVSSDDFYVKLTTK